MRATRYATTRQKACYECSAAKAKCDRKPRGCTRCAQRDLICAYPQGQPLEVSGSRSVEEHDETMTSVSLSTSGAIPVSQGLLPSPEYQTPAGANTLSPVTRSASLMGGNSPDCGSDAMLAGNISMEDSMPNSTSHHRFGDSDKLDFTGLELFSPINVSDISNRWLNSFVDAPGQKIKEYPATITAFVYRILKSYASVAVRGRGVPPFIHSSQISGSYIRSPLSTCLSLVRVCENSLPGSEDAVARVLQSEMGSIYEQHRVYDEMTLLAAFQAYLIYSMVLFFRLGQVSSSFLRQAMTSLQDLACSSSRQGVMCTAERVNARPRWEAWIVAESKRRSLYIMYLFDSALSAQDGLPTFLGTELQGLPTSSNKSLWKAETRHEWETAYNIHLADWAEGGLRIDELWPIPEDLDEQGIFKRRNRVDRWLENVDEFGTMLYAITSCTHGG